MRAALMFVLAMVSFAAMAADTQEVVADSSEAYVSASRDSHSSAGGWGKNCTSGTVYCNSGRQLGCSSTIGNIYHGSQCAQHTGSVGWVSCRTFDRTGMVTSSFYDECP